MSTATKGRAYEHEVRKIFEAHGYSAVRAAASKGEVDCGDGIFKPDLILTKRTAHNKYDIHMVFAQCKVRAV